jgi:FkbM family methyltransferase
LVPVTRFDRTWGLVRSIATYHAMPGRQRRLRRFYGRFLGRGDLVFDVGAHVGNHVRSFAALGCRVVALEPQPALASLLRRWFASEPLVTVLEAAASETAGRASLAISDRTPTVATLAAGWRDRRASEPDFATVRWNRQVDVDTTTLDTLIEQFGRPAFVKIDAEGSEPAVLAGLSTPVGLLAFEYLPRALDQVEACVTRLSRLGDYAFNWSVGETYRLGAPEWLGGRGLVDRLRTEELQRRSGDVYARLRSATLL